MRPYTNRHTFQAEPPANPIRLSVFTIRWLIHCTWAYAMRPYANIISFD